MAIHTKLKGLHFTERSSLHGRTRFAEVGPPRGRGQICLKLVHLIFSLSMSIAETFAQSHTRHTIIPSRLHADTEHVRTLPLKEGNREVCSVNSIRQQSACNKRDLGNSRDHPFPSPRPRRQRSRHSNAQLAEPPTPLPAPRPAPTRLARLGDAPSAHTAHPFAARGPSPMRTIVSPQSAPAR